MKKNLATITADLDAYLSSDNPIDPMGFLETLQLQLGELYQNLPTFEDLKALVGEGIHKGMRLTDGAEYLYKAVEEVEPQVWDAVLGFLVTGLDYSDVIELREV